MKGCDYDYKWKLHEMDQAIGRAITEEPEKVEKFRRALYGRIAGALMIVFGGMALVSGLFGAINLIVCISDGVIHALGAVAWILGTTGLAILSMIADAADEVM